CGGDEKRKRQQPHAHESRIDGVIADLAAGEVNAARVRNQKYDPAHKCYACDRQGGVGIEMPPRRHLADFVPPRIFDEERGTPANQDEQNDDGRNQAKEAQPRRRAASARNQSLFHMILPPTIVARGPPRKRLPLNGELRLFENDSCTSYVHSVVVSKTVMSAGAPGESVPRFSLRMPAGPVVNSSTIRLTVMCPGWTSSERDKPRAVSSPVMPNGQRSNSCIFSSPACGAWSVAMASTTPLATASITACTSCLQRSGGFIL